MTATRIVMDVLRLGVSLLWLDLNHLDRRWGRRGNVDWDKPHWNILRDLNN